MGTPTPIQLQDPKYNVFVPIRSFGQFGIQIQNAWLFLSKLVGTMPVFDSEHITQFFKGLYLTKVKDVISSYLLKNNHSVLEINAYLDEISTYLRDSIAPVLEEYGIQLLNFYVNDISVPENDPAIVQLKSALAKRAEMDIIGYDYVQERSFDTLESATKNTGDGKFGILGAGIGLALGTGIGNALGEQTGAISTVMNVKETTACPMCHSTMDSSQRFCPKCGFDTHLNFPQNSNATVKCSSCGNIYPPSSKFCPQCGDPYRAYGFCGADLKQDSAVCPICGKEALPLCHNYGTTIKDLSSKFCPECGTSQVKTCNGCGFSSSMNTKFCPECGDEL